jgi:hypothetical protein
MTCERCGSSERCRTVHRTRRRPARPIVIERCAECFSAIAPDDLIEEIAAAAPEEEAAVMTKDTLRHAIRWRAPRMPRTRRRPAVEEPEPVTLRDPSVVLEQARVAGRPAVFDALCASLEVLAAESVPCELDVVVDAGTSARLYRDPEIAAHLLSPFVASMPLREGLLPIGTIRVAGRRVRIYERAA